MRYFCGIDIGASAAKLVLIDDEGQTAARSMRRSGVDYAATAQRCLDEALAMAGVAPADIAATCATGYGRDNVPWAESKATEIACHGRGAFAHFRRAITVVDIGAQDSKVIHLDDAGRRTNFKMNRKCAAGTGAFLEEIAHRLDLPLDQLNGLAERSTQTVTLGSFCTVFAATEILEKIRHGCAVEDIIKGAFRSVLQRIVEMDTFDGSLVMTGGVAAHNRLLAELAADYFGRAALLPPEPQFTGALGAALFAKERWGHNAIS
jgi:predicted CoA-substrate-specific enzyme activase